MRKMTRLFGDFVEASDGKKPISRIFKNTEFGYRTITVERPLRDANGNVVLGEKGKLKGKPQPDANLRDTENVPLSEDVEAYFKREVLPHASDAWIDEEKTKVGYEIPFNRYFYVFEPPRELAAIDADLEAVYGPDQDDDRGAHCMSFPQYEIYKDSGLQWLGAIPSHWIVVQSRRLFALRKDRAVDNERQLTASQNMGSSYQDDYVALEGQKVVQVITGAEILKHVEPNDFVISMRSFQGGIEWCGHRAASVPHT